MAQSTWATVKFIHEKSFSKLWMTRRAYGYLSPNKFCDIQTRSSTHLCQAGSLDHLQSIVLYQFLQNYLRESGIWNPLQGSKMWTKRLESGILCKGLKCEPRGKGWIGSLKTFVIYNSSSYLVRLANTSLCNVSNDSPTNSFATCNQSYQLV